MHFQVDRAHCHFFPRRSAMNVAGKGMDGLREAAPLLTHTLVTTALHPLVDSASRGLTYRTSLDTHPVESRQTAPASQSVSQLFHGILQEPLPTASPPAGSSSLFV